MHVALVSIETATHPLDGLLYEPTHVRAENAVLLLHGNCMNFYTGPSRFLAAPLARAGFAVLAFNRRGHDVLHTQGRAASGGAFQLVEEMIEDNERAAAFLAQRGHPRPVVIGHSNGGMLAVRHVAARPETPAMVTLSAHRGGPDLARLISAAGLFAQDRYDALLAEASDRVAQGRGGELMLLPGWWHVASAATIVDFCTRLPDVIALAPRVECPSLVIRGDREDPLIYPTDAFAARAGGPCDVHVEPGCDHFYTGREAAVSDRVVAWLRSRRAARDAVSRP